MLLQIRPNNPKSIVFVGILGLLFLSSCESNESVKNPLDQVETVVESGPWADFKNSFPEMELPFKVPLEMDSSLIAGLREIKGDELKFIDESAEGFEYRTPHINQYYCYGKMFETDEIVALVYFGRTEFLQRLAPISYTLVTFTHEGKLIDKQVVGGRQFLSDNFLQTTFKTRRIVKANIEKPIYKKDPLKYGYIDNPILSTKKMGYKEYKISKAGEIVEKGEFKK